MVIFSPVSPPIDPSVSFRLTVVPTSRCKIVRVYFSTKMRMGISEVRAMGVPFLLEDAAHRDHDDPISSTLPSAIVESMRFDACLQAGVEFIVQCRNNGKFPHCAQMAAVTGPADEPATLPSRTRFIDVWLCKRCGHAWANHRTPGFACAQLMPCAERCRCPEFLS